MEKTSEPNLFLDFNQVSLSMEAKVATLLNEEKLLVRIHDLPAVGSNPRKINGGGRKGIQA